MSVGGGGRGGGVVVNDHDVPQLIGVLLLLVTLLAVCT